MAVMVFSKNFNKNKTIKQPPIHVVSVFRSECKRKEKNNTRV